MSGFSAVEAAFVVPVLIVVFMVVPPYALARGVAVIVAQATASQAANVASASNATAEDGEEQARMIVAELHGLPDMTVAVTRGRTARAVVTGYPFGLRFFPVTAVAERRVSGFMADDRP